jgi:hypothetical protein
MIPSVVLRYSPETTQGLGSHDLIMHMLLKRDAPQKRLPSELLSQAHPST